MLYEGAHNETGGGQAFDLLLKSRTSDQLTAQADLVIGANLGDAIHWQPELTLGWRQIVTGGPGTTTASFAAAASPVLSLVQFHREERLRWVGSAFAPAACSPISAPTPAGCFPAAISSTTPAPWPGSCSDQGGLQARLSRKIACSARQFSIGPRRVDRAAA